MTGKVSYISSDVINVKFSINDLPQIGTILTTKSGNILSVETIKSSTEVVSVIIQKGSSLTIEETVTSTGKPIQAPVGNTALGRIFNTLGQPIDNKALASNQKFVNATVYKKTNRGFVHKEKILETGIKALDFFIPVIEGDKIGMFGGAGVGKTLVIKEIINNLTKKNVSKKLSSIFVGIGERSREGEELYRELEEANLLNNVMLYFAQMNETPGSRMKLIYSAIASAEYFRDVEKKDTLMFIDNIYRFTQAGAELSSSLGNIPSQSGYQPTLMTEIANVQERLSNSKDGSITSFQTVFVPADDITDPATVNIFSHLDGSMVLDRAIAASGKYPAISPLESSSNNLTVNLVGKIHVNAVMDVKKHLHRFEELEDLLAILGVEGISEKDRLTIERARKLINFFTQDFHTAEAFTQRKGVSVPLEKTIDGVLRIMNGEFDEVDPIKFLYIETVDDVEIEVEKKEDDEAKLTRKQIKQLRKEEIRVGQEIVINQEETKEDKVEEVVEEIVEEVVKEEIKKEPKKEKKVNKEPTSKPIKKTSVKKKTVKKPAPKKKEKVKKEKGFVVKDNT